jgi:hypothetical protein
MKNCFSEMFFSDDNSVTCIESLSDYYVRQGNNVFIIECKDVMLNANTKHSYNYDTIKKEIFSKFVKEVGKKDKIKPKGVTQLCDSISTLNQKGINFENRTTHIELTQLNIYPIIVFTDYVLNIDGIEQILQDEFQKQLQELKPNFTVNPLVMIDLDTLIKYECVFAKQPFNSVIESYYIQKADKAKNRYNNIENYLSSFTTFSNFLDNYVLENNITITPPKILDGNPLGLPAE